MFILKAHELGSRCVLHCLQFFPDLTAPLGMIQHSSDEQMTGKAKVVPSVSQPYPNPFKPMTDIKVGFNHAGVMSLTVYNIPGQEADVDVKG